jgi:hypothetical protein
MNWLINLYWDARFKIEDAISDWKWNCELNKEDDSFVSEDNDEALSSWEDEEVEVKPKKKKAKKKSVKKAKKSV